MTTRVSFIAHAATEAQRRAAFPLDESIIEREQQGPATRPGSRLPKASQIWSAPEQRTQETCRLLGLSPILADGLRDCDYGGWRGRTMEQIQADNPQGLMAWLSDPAAAPHGGEAILQVVNRVGRWLDEQNGTGHFIAVTHPAVIRAAIVFALRVPLEGFWRLDIAPLTLTDLRRSGDVWTVRCSGCALAAIE
jgi:broad specificity phosphatase PhoE